jgi:hypothetical protein
MIQVGCGFFGCQRRLLDNVQVDIVVNGDALSISTCAYHLDIIINGDPTKYSIGYAYTGEPEIRLHPAVAPPAP